MSALSTSPSDTPASPAAASADAVPLRLVLLWVVLTGVLLFIVRLTGPPNLMGKDQERPAAYVMDAVVNGHWIVQRDETGDIASKPPLYPWVAGVTALVLGKPDALALYLPTGLATLVTAVLLVVFGHRFFGWRAGLCTGLAWVLSPAVAKMIALARTDALFVCLVTVTALLAHRAWALGRGWMWFWLAAAAATLTKGPLGLGLGAGGLLAHWWERRTGHESHLNRWWWPGVALFLGLCGGWFALACAQDPEGVYHKMIVRELVGHAAGGQDTGRIPGTGLPLPFLYFLGRHAPWSVVACIGFWRVWKQPAEDPVERRFERFLVCWFAAGLLVFSLAAHQRGDLVFPLLPAATILAGRELARWLEKSTSQVVFRWTVVVTAFGLAAVTVNYHGFKLTDPEVRRSQVVEAQARRIEYSFGRAFPLTYAGAPYALQFHLGTMRPNVPPDRAARLLAGDAAAFVVVRDLESLRARFAPLSTNGSPAETIPGLRSVSATGNFTVLEVVPQPGDKPFFIVGNRPQLRWQHEMAAVFGGLFVRMEGLRLMRDGAHALEFQLEGTHGTAVLVNESATARKLSVRLPGVEPGARHTELQPGETWRIEIRAPGR